MYNVLNCPVINYLILFQVAHFMFNGTDCLSRSYNNMNIEAPPGSCIGGVKSDNSFSFQQWFSVMNSDDQTVLKITKSAGQFFSSEVDFKVYYLSAIVAEI